MSSTTRRVFAAALALGALATTAGLVMPASAQELKEVRIGFQKAGIFPAVKQRGTLEKVFQARGISVKWIEFQFGPPILEAINTGNVDFGYTGDAPPIFAQAARGNLLYVAALPASGKNEALIVKEDSPIKTLADLKGKRIGFAKGSSAHNTTVAILEKAGLSYADITPVTLAPADASVAFAGGNIDAWTIWDPFLALTERSKVRVIATAGDAHKSNGFFLANRDFTGKHPEVVALLNKTFADEIVWARENRPEVAKALHAATSVDAEALKVAVDRSAYLVSPITPAIIETQQKTADRFHKLGLIPKPIVVKDIVWTWTPAS